MLFIIDPQRKEKHRKAVRKRNTEVKKARQNTKDSMTKHFFKKKKRKEQPIPK